MYVYITFLFRIDKIRLPDIHLLIYKFVTRLLNHVVFSFLSISDLMNYEFDRKDLVCLILCTIVGVWYLLKKVRVTTNTAVLSIL